MRRSPEQLTIVQQEMRARWQAGSARVRPGRPARQLDANIVYVLALQGMTHAAIAQHFRCDRKTLERRCGAVLKRAAQRRAMLLPRSLWQRASASNVTLAAIDAEFEAHYLNLEELDEMVGQGSGENHREKKHRNSRSNKRQISVTKNAGIIEPQHRDPQSPTSDICNLQQKFAGEVAQGKELSPELFPNASLPKTHEKSRKPGDYTNTPEPRTVNEKNHSPTIANISDPAPARKPGRRP